AQVAQRFGCGLDRLFGRVLPGLRTHADHVDDPVNAALAAFRHGDLPSLLLAGGSLTRMCNCASLVVLEHFPSDSRRTSVVIPGRREAANPEPMNTGRCRIRSVRVHGPRAPSLRSGPGVTTS